MGAELLHLSEQPVDGGTAAELRRDEASILPRNEAEWLRMPRGILLRGNGSSLQVNASRFTIYIYI